MATYCLCALCELGVRGKLLMALHEADGEFIISMNGSGYESVMSRMEYHSGCVIAVPFIFLTASLSKARIVLARMCFSRA